MPTSAGPPRATPTEERAFRAKIERELAEAHARGESLGFTAVMPDLHD